MNIKEKVMDLILCNCVNKAKRHELSSKIALVGNPNVGKSLIFNNLTGAYVTVSNYPGTTVDISEGTFEYKGVKATVFDTPGMYSILPISEEEKVARDLLFIRKPGLVIHVVDAKNIKRMLPLTYQLIDAGFNVVLVLNVMDEAESLGININSKLLQARLGIKVLEASAAHGKGIDELKMHISKQLKEASAGYDILSGGKYAPV
jgi:ferrous iron transport protein B